MRELVELKSETMGRKIGPRAADFEALRAFGQGGIIAEIGVYRGEHAEAMIELLKPSLFVAVDFWDFIEGDIFQHPNADESVMPMHDLAYLESWYRLHGRKEVLVVKGMSSDVALFSNLQYHYVYVDGGHLYKVVKKDLELWYPNIRIGGLFAGHDYSTNADNDTPCGVSKAVNEMFGDRVCHSEGDFADWWVWKK